jgi:hypothetical protein
MRLLFMSCVTSPDDARGRQGGAPAVAASQTWRAESFPMGTNCPLEFWNDMKKPSTPPRRDTGQDIVRDERGQDQPANRDRAQQVTTTRKAGPPDARRKSRAK